jgi:Bax protein
LPIAIISINEYDKSLREISKKEKIVVQNRKDLNSSVKKEKVLTVTEKKSRFKKLLVPPTIKVYNELFDRYNRISKDINNSTNLEEIAKLKKEYKVKTDKELLIALKPHPISIVLAQAAIESGWGTSRFFKEANNAFGVWSFNKNEPRIAAGNTRSGKTIWLKKYNSIEDSVRDNYKNLGRSPFFKDFRKLRFISDNPHELVKKLTRYSEKGDEYGRILSSVIKHNNLEKFDK